jgi:hypothetical protein
MRSPHSHHSIAAPSGVSTSVRSEQIADPTLIPALPDAGFDSHTENHGAIDAGFGRHPSTFTG